LHEAPQEQNNRLAIIMGAAPHRARENVEDFAALPTAIFDHRGAPAVVRGLVCGQAVPGRTAEPVGVQGALEVMVALLFIEQLGDWKLHHADGSPQVRVWLLLVPILHPGALFQLDTDMSEIICDDHRSCFDFTYG
jgi:hypothetical protein